MRWRLAITVGVLALSCAGGGVMIGLEDRIEGLSQAGSGQISPLETKVVALDYDRPQRAYNLRVLGLDAAQQERALRRLAGLDVERDRIVETLRRAPDPGVLGRAFCPAHPPTVYRAAAALLEGEGGQARLRDPSREDLGEVWGGFDEEQAFELFDAWEARVPRHPDATRMALGAILVARGEQALGDRDGPWSPNARWSGSWKDLDETWPDLGRLLAEYVAVTHFVTELAVHEPSLQHWGCPEQGVP